MSGSAMQLSTDEIVRAVRGLDTRPLLEAARVYYAALDVYDKKSTPANLRLLTLAQRAMREVYREEREGKVASALSAANEMTGLLGPSA